MVKLTIKQTDAILKKLKDYELEVIDTEENPFDNGFQMVDNDYFNEKVNEALEDG